jgi:hypothetical protein
MTRKPKEFNVLVKDYGSICVIEKYYYDEIKEKLDKLKEIKPRRYETAKRYRKRLEDKLGI